MKYLLSRDDLGKSVGDAGRGTTYRLDGGAHGLASHTFIVGKYQPSCVARRHRHSYEEVFVVHEGCGAATVGSPPWRRGRTTRCWCRRTLGTRS